MEIDLRIIDDNNIKEVLGLRVSKDQEHLIETVARCLEEEKEPIDPAVWYSVAIYNRDNLVGYGMYGVLYEEDEFSKKQIWIDRLLIDSKYQGLGLGKKAMEAMIDLVKERFDCRIVYLSVYETNEIAIKMYLRMGFRFNGDLDTLGEKIMVLEV